jgi:hypothetical protein
MASLLVSLKKTAVSLAAASYLLSSSSYSSTLQAQGKKNQTQIQQAIEQKISDINQESNLPSARKDLEKVLAQDLIEHGFYTQNQMTTQAYTTQRPVICAATKKLASGNLTFCVTQSISKAKEASTPGQDKGYFITVIEAIKTTKEKQLISRYQEKIHAQPITIYAFDFGKNGISMKDFQHTLFSNAANFKETYVPVVYSITSDKDVIEGFYITGCHGKQKTLDEGPLTSATVAKAVSIIAKPLTAIISLFGYDINQYALNKANESYVNLLAHNKDPAKSNIELSRLLNAGWDRFADIYSNSSAVELMKTCTPLQSNIKKQN